MNFQPWDPLFDQQKLSFDGIDRGLRTKYNGHASRTNDPAGDIQGIEAGKLASTFGDEFRARKLFKDAIKWHLQDCYHQSHGCRRSSDRARKQEAADGEVDAWAQVARCWSELARPRKDTSTRLEGLRRGCGFLHRAVDAAAHPMATKHKKTCEALIELGQAQAGLLEPMHEDENQEKKEREGQEALEEQHMPELECVRSEMEIEAVRAAAVDACEEARRAARVLSDVRNQAKALRICGLALFSGPSDANAGHDPFRALECVARGIALLDNVPADLPAAHARERREQQAELHTDRALYVAELCCCRVQKRDGCVCQRFGSASQSLKRARELGGDGMDILETRRDVLVRQGRVDEAASLPGAGQSLVNTAKQLPMQLDELKRLCRDAEALGAAQSPERPPSEEAHELRRQLDELVLDPFPQGSEEVDQGLGLAEAYQHEAVRRARAASLRVLGVALTSSGGSGEAPSSLPAGACAPWLAEVATSRVKLAEQFEKERRFKDALAWYGGGVEAFEAALANARSEGAGKGAMSSEGVADLVQGCWEARLGVADSRSELANEERAGSPERVRRRERACAAYLEMAQLASGKAEAEPRWRGRQAEALKSQQNELDRMMRDLKAAADQQPSAKLEDARRDRNKAAKELRKLLRRCGVNKVRGLPDLTGAKLAPAASSDGTPRAAEPRPKPAHEPERAPRPVDAPAPSPRPTPPPANSQAPAAAPAASSSAGFTGRPNMCKCGRLLKNSYNTNMSDDLCCDGPCGSPIPLGKTIWSCVACDFDLCTRCATRQSESGAPTSSRLAPSAIAPPPRPNRPKPAAKPRPPQPTAPPRVAPSRENTAPQFGGSAAAPAAAKRSRSHDLDDWLHSGGSAPASDGPRGHGEQQRASKLPRGTDAAARGGDEMDAPKAAVEEPSPPPQPRVKLEVDVMGRLFRYPRPRVAAGVAAGGSSSRDDHDEEEAEGGLDVDWLLGRVRRWMRQVHGLRLDPAATLRGELNGGGDGAPPPGGQPGTGGLPACSAPLQSDLLLEDLIENAQASDEWRVVGGVARLSLRGALAPVQPPAELYRQHCTRASVAPRDAVCGAFDAGGRVAMPPTDAGGGSHLKLARLGVHDDELAPALHALAACAGSWLERCSLTSGSLDAAQLDHGLLRLLPPAGGALRWLDLSSQQLHGAAALHALRDAADRGCLPRLEMLSLAFNPLTDACAAAARPVSGAPTPSPTDPAQPGGEAARPEPTSELARLISPDAAWQLSELSLHGCLLGTAAAEQITAVLALGACSSGSETAAGRLGGDTAGVRGTHTPSRLIRLDLGGNDELISSNAHVARLRDAWKRRRADLGQGRGPAGLKMDKFVDDLTKLSLGGGS